MTPGTVITDVSADEAVAQFFDDDQSDFVVVFEALAGGDGTALRAADARYKAVVAAMAARLGKPSETPTRKQGIAKPPQMIDPRWTNAAVWRTEHEIYVATLSGPQGGAHEVILCRGQA